jgi:hypothetical protein
MSDNKENPVDIEDSDSEADIGQPVGKPKRNKSAKRHGARKNERMSGEADKKQKQQISRSATVNKKSKREMVSDGDVEFVREVNPSQENDRIMCMRIRLNADKLLFRLIHPDGVHI